MSIRKVIAKVYLFLMVLVALTAVSSAGQIKHRFVATDESAHQIIYVDQFNPENDWSIPLKGNRDVHITDKGTVLASVPDGYREYDLNGGKLIKSVKAGKDIFSLLRLGNGHTVLASRKAIIELDENDKQVKTYPINPGSFFRVLRMSKKGNFLMTGSATTVKEIALDGSTVRELEVSRITPSCKKPYLVEELADGKFFVSAGYGGQVHVVDKDWKLLKTFGGKDGEVKINFAADVQQLKNGNVVLTNWTGHKRQDSQKAAQLVEYDKDGKVVWTWHDPKRAGSLHGAAIIDDAKKSPVTARPNIVYILADDMSYDSVSAYNDKIGKMKTPCIDKLVTQGMSFMDAHSSSSVCTPTRYGLLTGRYCWRTKLKKQVLWDYGRPLIEKGRLTVAGLLKEQGYATGMIGKWHLGLDWYDKDGNLANKDLKISDAIWKEEDGAAERVKACEKRIDWSKSITGGPTDHGFGYYFGVDLPNMPPYGWIENDRLVAMPTAVKPEEMFGKPGSMVPGWKLEGILPTLALKSVKYIEEQSKKDKPFFLYVSLTSPHSPIAPSKDFIGKSGVNKYADFVIETDWVVGHIVDAIDKAGIADNTLVVFTTDNGTAWAAKFKDLKELGVDLKNHYRGHKAQIYEGGHRLPFIVRWPGVVKANSKCEQTICHNDLMATVAEILGVTLPDDSAEDSYSILPLITGEQTKQPYRPMVVHHDYRGRFAIRRGKWKLAEYGEGKFLFDLENDVKETTNVAKKHPWITRRLSNTLKKYKDDGRTRLKSSLPKVLIIGDSISLGYTPYVKQMLEGKANVIHHKGNAKLGPNGGPTIRGVEYIDEWLGGEKWDVIHFNWGLWDMYGWKYENHDRSPQAYANRLDKLVLRMKQTGAELIWGTTTPVCPGPENLCKLVISKETEKKYLDAARCVMIKHGVKINDLYAFMNQRRAEYARGDNDVHFTKDGSRKLAERVADNINDVINKKHLFILSGQSNMAGLNPNISFTPTVGTEFGKDNVIVVKDAQGGQPILRWYKKWKSPIDDGAKAKGDLYDRLMKKVNAAIKDENVGTVTFVWMQGERDARAKYGEVYAESLKGLYDQLSSDLKRDDINFVIGRISDFDMNNKRYPHWTMVRDLQVKVANENPRFEWVNTDDLNDKSRNGKTWDDLHYTKDGYKVLGKRFADKAIKCIEK